MRDREVDLKFAEALKPEVGPVWALSRQMGLDHAVTISDPRTDIPLWDYPPFARLKMKYEDAGFNLEVVEGWLPMDRIRRGTEGRDEELECVLQTIRNMGALDIPVLCYSWMSFFNWTRTSVTTKTRGGAVTSSYDHAVMQRSPQADTLRITEQELWDNLRYFFGTGSAGR